MRTRIKEFTVIIFMLINLSCTTTPDLHYKEAMKEIKSGNIDFAFMELKTYLRENPDSIHTREIRFAICEYYFQIKDYRDAIYKLMDYIIDYPQDASTIPAKALLYKGLLEYNKEPELLQKLKESFFSKSLFLIFSETKTKNYKSLLNNTYKIIDYIDRVEIFRNNDLILKITP